MTLHTLDAPTLMSMVLNSLKEYCTMLHNGIYTDDEFNKCRNEMLKIREALREVLSQQTSPKFLSKTIE